jgi:DNA-binding MarR family transcriptional regulator
MKNNNFRILFKLYLLGKKLEALGKKHNIDQMSQSIILGLVAYHPQPVNTLAQTLSIKLSAATSKIRVMEKAGLLERLKAHDKREHVVAITALGKQTLVDIKMQITARCRHCSIGLSEDEAHQVEILLDKIRLEDFV